MKRLVTFAYPGDLELKTGGYAYDRQIIAGLRSLGWDVRLLPLGAGFPFPSKETLLSAERDLTSLPDGSLVIIDGLAFGVLDGWASANRDRLSIIALVHHPLALETGTTTEARTHLLQSEGDALKAACHVVVTSNVTARAVAELFAVDARRITIACPGTQPGLPRSKRDDRPHILSVGTLIERKGHDVLIAALKMIEHLDWNASIVGSRTLDPRTSAVLERQIVASGLQDRITLCGEVPDTRPLMAEADIFALASRYEGYGMVFAEALAQGLPIVACRTGAIPEVVPEEAGFLVPVDDIKAFSQALGILINQPEVRREKAASSALAGSRLSSWDQTSTTLSHLLEALS